MGELLCPYCKAGLDESAIVRCVQCNTVHHSICWLEYGNRCSVFSCHGQRSAFRKKQGGSTLLLVAWCILNYVLHVCLQLIGQLTGPVPLPDVFIVALLEAIVLVTGWIALKPLSASEPVRTAGILLFSGNVLFVSLLSSHWIAHGFERLNALIRL